MQPNQTRRPCKYREGCKNFAQGNCTFLHDSGSEQGSRSYNPNTNPKFTEPRNQNYSQQQNYPAKN